LSLCCMSPSKEVSTANILRQRCNIPRQTSLRKSNNNQPDF
jgi:hypothetical protein